MGRKKGRVVSASVIVGAVFASMGAMFLTVGILVGSAVDNDGGEIIRFLFVLMGGLFFLIGLALLVLAGRKKRKREDLVRTGHYVWGEIVDYQYDMSVHINGRCPLYLRVRYAAPDGTIHYFKSENFLDYSCTEMVGYQVKVYVDRDDFNQYHVDVEPLRKKVIEH